MGARRKPSAKPFPLRGGRWSSAYRPRNARGRAERARAGLRATSNVISRALAGDECVGPSGALEYENDSIFPLLQDKATVCGARLDLRKLWRIRVVEEDAEGDISGRVLAGYFVWVQESSTRYVIVNVPRVRLGELMAALTFYSPNATLMFGAGF